MCDLTLQDVSDPHARKAPAGPTPGTTVTLGLRDYFAAAALANLGGVSLQYLLAADTHAASVARAAFRAADAMLRERAKPDAADERLDQQLAAVTAERDTARASERQMREQVNARYWESVSADNANLNAQLIRARAELDDARAALAKAGPAAPAGHKRLTDDEVADRYNAALEAGPRLGNVYRHRKTGRLYSAHAAALVEATLEPVVTYIDLTNGNAWTRPTAEFMEKFEPAPTMNVRSVDLGGPGTAAAD